MHKEQEQSNAQTEMQSTVHRLLGILLKKFSQCLQHYKGKRRALLTFPNMLATVATTTVATAAPYSTTINKS